MADWLLQHNVIVLAVFAGLFTWGMTATGALMVFFFRQIAPRVYTVMLGFAGGIMLAASFWSLLLPSIEMATENSQIIWLPALVGFLAGGIFLRGIDFITPHLHLGEVLENREGPKTRLKRSWLMIIAVTIHNIPEGLAIGVAFGSIASQNTTMGIMSAVSLALGIGLQNIPEGFAVAAPLRGEGFSRKKSFFYGQLSGIVELFGAVAGAAIASVMSRILPYALSFAAGAMVYVIVEELIPEAQQSKHADLATLSLMFGFVIMMVMDIALGV